jgi:hypothetical protein
MSGWGLLLCNLIPNPIFFSRRLWCATKAYETAQRN